MAKKRSKADAIRAYMEKHPNASPTEVALDLAHLGVTPQYVSFTKSQDKRGKKKAKPKATKAAVHTNGNGNGHVPTASVVYASAAAIDIIRQTRVLAERCGGYGDLKKLIEVLES